jgi:uncharacterized protein (TIGR02145 family)
MIRQIILVILLLLSGRPERLFGQYDFMPLRRELALETPKVFINPGEATYSADCRMWQGIPGIERAANGRLWVSRFSGSTGEGASNNYVMLITSDDDGQTWSDLKVVVDMPDSPVRLYDPCLWIDPLGRLWFIWCQAYAPWLHHGVWALVSENPEDADPVWSEPRRLCEGINLNKPLVLSNGDWIFPTTFKWDRQQVPLEPDRIQHSSCEVVVTTDQGKSFFVRGTASVLHPDRRIASEPMIVERQDGSLWMLVRTGFGIGETFSEDRGRSWTPIERIDNIKHPISRFFIRRLSSGNLLLVKHGPIDRGSHRELLKAYLSKDDGETWEGGLMLDERYHLSYPDGIQAPDGSIYVVYDHGRYPGTHREILMAVFTEEDVLAGKPSENTRLKVLVNAALEPLCNQKTSPLEQVARGTVRIADQEWMNTNLDVERFRNGDRIHRAKTAEEWEKAGKEGRPAWCYYGNNPENGIRYGKLYNWFAVADPRGLAPEGWHIPSEEEWNVLTENLGGFRKAGTLMKSTGGWACDGNGTNKNGFTGFPGGIRRDNGTFDYLGEYGYWWSSTELRPDYAQYKYLYCRAGKVFRYTNFYKSSGFSVRCLKD